MPHLPPTEVDLDELLAWADHTQAAQFGRPVIDTLRLAIAELRERRRDSAALTAAAYQAQAARTLISDTDVPAFAPRDLAGAWALLDLARRLNLECDRVKKDVFHQHGYGRAQQHRTASTLRDLAERMQEYTCQIDELGGLEGTPGAGGLPPGAVRYLWNALGVAGEAGEIAAHVLAQVEIGALDRAAFGKEIGDECWYLAALATQAGLDFDAILEGNLAKLRARYPAGWSAAASQAREV